MRLTENIMQLVDDMKPEIANRLAEYRGDIDDVIQECYVNMLEAEDTQENPEGYARRLVVNTTANYVRDQRNRRKLEQDNADLIVRNTTPTLSLGMSGDPAEFIEAEDLLRARWKTLSPLLRTVARRSFFGYKESPERIAHDLGTTVAAVNMARTRIKQHLNGVEK